MNQPRIVWPDGKRFAFTVFDDPDAQTLETGRRVYEFLAESGFRTTKGIWPVRGPREPSDCGGTCAEPDYLRWCQELQQQGFEIGYHNATLHTSFREETMAALELFEQQFGHSPSAMANHFAADEGIYWGENRLSSWRRVLYNVLTRGVNRSRFFGHQPGHPLFWGDLCRDRIRYVRNFVFGDINTLKSCPWMPYHDPARPWVREWYCGSEGSQAPQFIDTIHEVAQDRLEQEGGACIMYTHFGHGYVDGRSLNPRFVSLMKRLSARGGWFVPVSTLLDYLREQGTGGVTITDAQRSRLETRWLWHKIRYGTA